MHDQRPSQKSGARILEFPLARARPGNAGARAPRQLSIPLQEVPSYRNTLSASGGRVQVGLSSWTDKGLIASMGFYPKGCSSAEERLRYYASRFPTVGVDCSFALPCERNSRLWVDRTPDGFTFNVKALRLLAGYPMFAQTLPRDLAVVLGPRLATKRNLYYRELPDELRGELWDRFKLGLRPLHQAGKLGSVLLRFPDWIPPGPDACAHLRECARHLRGYPLAVEFDHPGWFDNTHVEATLGLERELGITHVVAEGPLDGTRFLPTWKFTTSNLAVVRVDGRPALSPADAAHDLKRLVRQTSILAEWVHCVHVIFDHAVQDEAARKAVQLQETLET